MSPEDKEYRQQNDLVRSQLETVRDNVTHYLEKDEMPHEWGSMDSLDDMRNSMDIASALMSECDVGFMPDVKAIINDFGECAAHDDVIKAAQSFTR